MNPYVRLYIAAPRAQGHKKARLIDVDGLTWTFTHAPPRVEHLDQNLEWVVVPRPANVPLVERAGSGLARLRLSWLQAFPSRTESVEGRLSGLKGLCRNGKLLRFDYGPNETGWWRCVGLSWETLDRNLAAEATRAQVELELARAVDAKAGALVDLVRPAA